ncbi:MAG: transporter substrate-binding domain-containing protein [Cyclobacteriaceae bacterium]|nr:transporter substrate-binding domain-containing protein [Cyclobacteriaceae bacterium]
MASLSVNAQTYKVGVFENPPMVYMNDDGEAEGFFIDLLNHIAAENGWTLAYYPCAFADCKKMLERNTIDILPDLGHSIARDSIFNFNEASIISTWGEVYYAPSRNYAINDIVDLDGLRIASLDGDYFCENGGTGLVDLGIELGLDLNIYRVESYGEALRLAEKGSVDAALVSKIFGDYNAHNYNVTKSQIMISHLSLRYGISKKNPDNGLIKKAIDKEVRLQVSDENSLYYALREEYFIGMPIEIIPKWLWQIVLSLLVVVGVLIIASLVLRYQVERKTKELKETNKILRASEHEARLALNTIEASSDLAFWSKPGLGIIRVNNKALDILGYSINEILSLKPGALVPEDKREEFLERLQLTDQEHPNLRFEGELLKKSGEKLPVEISLDYFEFEGVPYICGFARDITERKMAFKQRQELMSHLAERNKELNCLYDVSKLTSDTHNSIEEILQKAVDLIPLSWFYPTIACAKILCDFGEFMSSDFEESEWKIEAPIIMGDGSKGSLVVYYKEQRPELNEGPFSFEERNLIDTLGELLGNMLSVKGTEQKIIATIMNTEDRERTRISKEVHDSLGQTLSVIALNMDKVNQEVSQLSEKQQERFKNLNILINQAVNESRNIAHNLMPSTLSDFGYSLAVENMIETLKGATDTTFNFYTNYNENRLGKSAELGLYRITQEAVNNIIKHAQAKNVTIQLMCYPDIAILTIEDDGVGFDLHNSNELSRFGLNSMENRARSLNAEFSLASEPGKGTVITLQIHIK